LPADRWRRITVRPPIRCFRYLRESHLLHFARARFHMTFYNGAMADSLNLSIWFPSFREGEMLPRALGVLRQFPSSNLREGITYLSVHPVSWAEPTVLERRFTPGISPEEAADVAGEFAHDDFAFVFEA